MRICTLKKCTIDSSTSCLVNDHSPVNNGRSRQTHSQLNRHKIENYTHPHDPPPLPCDVSGWVEGKTNERKMCGKRILVEMIFGVFSNII